MAVQFRVSGAHSRKIEVRSSVGTTIDPSLTAGVLRRKIDDDQSCVEFFFRIMLRVVQNKICKLSLMIVPRGVTY